MKNFVLSVNGLHCANCAGKIEKKINELEEIKEATLDFLGKKVILTSSEKDEAVLVNKIQQIADKIEKGVVISSENIREAARTEEENESGVKGIIKTLVIGGIFFLISVVLPRFTKVPEKIELLLFLTSYIIVGHTVLITAVNNIKNGHIFDENFLMGIATIGAFFIGEYSEAVAVMFFYQIGELFQEMAVSRSRKSITSLMNIRPDYANLEKNGNIERVAPGEVKIGDIIVVKSGEKVPLDGQIIEGFTMFDTSALTGESLPREAAAGDEALSGFINKTGLVKIRVDKLFSESTVSKILDLVQNASSKKSRTEKFITKFARYYTPAVVMIALILAVFPPLFVSGATFSEWGYRALVFLVVSCPCALVVSIPLGFFGGVGGASRQGILIKGTNYLEALDSIETVVFDKTGTLTKGIFKVSEINVENNGYTEEELLKYAVYAESYSNHPIAKSIVEEYEKTGEKVNKSLLFGFEEKAGYGIKVRFANKEILAGNIKLMKSENIDVAEKDKAGTIVYVAVNGEYVGNLIINDEIKEDAGKAVSDLKNLGIKNIVMLTGDNRKIGESIAKKLGIAKVFSELLPADKVEKLEEILKSRSEKGKILFAGDGINDAPVLARADIGVAMGGLGSDAAIEAADVVIMTDEPSKIATAVKIAKKTKAVVWQNIIFAFAVKFIILVLGAGGIATMWEAVFADVGVAVVAILNAMRVMRMKI